MTEIKNGKFVIYNGREYQTGLWQKIPNMVRLASWNENDLDRGFYCVKSQEYMKLHGFRCQKEVPKSEITEAYKIETTAIYKNQKYYVDSALTQGEDMVRIYTPPISTVNETELYNEYKKNGFSDGMKYEYGNVLLYKYVSVNDPDLQLVEKRTELDISKL